MEGSVRESGPSSSSSVLALTAALASATLALVGAVSSSACGDTLAASSSSAAMPESDVTDPPPPQPTPPHYHDPLRGILEADQRADRVDLRPTFVSNGLGLYWIKGVNSYRTFLAHLRFSLGPRYLQFVDLSRYMDAASTANMRTTGQSCTSGRSKWTMMSGPRTRLDR